jgi:hypothetical protein
MTKELILVICESWDVCFLTIAMCMPSIQTQKKKGLITYYKIYGIIDMKKHVDNDHATIVLK